MTVLILDSREELPLRLADALLPDCRVHLCKTGKAAREQMLQLSPDVVVVGFPVLDCDTLALLDFLHTRFPEVHLVVSTRLPGDFFLDQLCSLGVAMVLREPWQGRWAAGHIRNLAGSSAETLQEECWRRATNLLLNLGVPGNCRGFLYLRRGILGQLRYGDMTAADRRCAAKALAQGRETPLGRYFFPSGRETVSEVVAILHERLKNDGCG